MYQQVKAAELMLETPNFFILNSRSLHIGRRFSALNADEDLEIANVYIMFPMKRLSSLVTAADLGALFLTANKSVSKRVSFGRVKILPECIEETNKTKYEKIYLPKLKLEDIEEFSTPEFKNMLSMCRFSDLTGTDYSEGAVDFARRLADRDSFTNIKFLIVPLRSIG
ncbi:hypothetical protein K7X08_023513 [Anisodus acutangulus]|uniref:Uncharacterized protein n=1 Tax=Anisodus acutangulus TaxID=402998 RepID=A0A9Q1L9U2_9SOLA|nr:hypothetical protein K7X08_023513 [Anisodus acutangulus]